MMRECLHCAHAFTPSDLSKYVSKEIEAARKSSGVRGVLFRCYVCPVCGQESLFVDLHQLDGETVAQFKRRRAELERTIRQVPSMGAQIGVMERLAR